jgi:hypothetical protein
MSSDLTNDPIKALRALSRKIPVWLSIATQRSSTMVMTRKPKSVRFTADTDFCESKRSSDKYLRSSPKTYQPGAHSCPGDSTWQDTSFMADVRYVFQRLPIRTTITVTSKAHAAEISAAFIVWMEKRPLFDSTDVLLKDYLLAELIYESIDSELSEQGKDVWDAFYKRVMASDSIVVYVDADEKLVAIEPINDEFVDGEVVEYLADLKGKIPRANIGIRRKQRLQQLREQ